MNLPFIAPHHIRLQRLERRIAAREHDHAPVRHLKARWRYLKAICAARGRHG